MVAFPAAEQGSSSPFRKRLGSKAYGAVFALIYLLYISFNLWEMSPRPSAVLEWVDLLAKPFFFFSGFVWLAPVPFEWAWPRGRSRLWWKGLIAGGVFSAAYMSLLVGFNDLLLWLNHQPGAWRSILGYHLTFYAPSMALIGSVVALRDAAERDKVTLRREAEQAQSLLLQSQLHPHVLFNALNGLAELVEKDPVAARRCLQSLSELLRTLLAAGQHAVLPLGHERGLVEHYVAMESMRLGDRLRVQWQWDPRTDELLFLPLLLQPLVENAIKHGISPALEGGTVHIESERSAAGVRLRVKNTGHPSSTPEGLGVGLTNLRNRLALAYGASAHFRLEHDGGWTLATLFLPLPASPLLSQG